jgi:hypothetical protein
LLAPTKRRSGHRSGRRWFAQPSQPIAIRLGPEPARNRPALEAHLDSKVTMAAGRFPVDMLTVIDAGSTSSMAPEPFGGPFESADSIGATIDTLIQDDDMYESGEPRPSVETASRAKNLLILAEREGCKFPHTGISVYFGEIDVTWRVQNRLLRLIVFPDPVRPAVLYFQTDKGEALTRGESVSAGPEDLSRKMAWLLG